MYVCVSVCVYTYIYHCAGFHEAHSHLKNFCGHELWRFVGRNQMENVEVVPVLHRKGCLSLPGFQENGKCLTLLCGVLVLVGQL